MKVLTAKNSGLSIEENIHAALKREFSYAESIVAGEVYRVGNKRKEIQILNSRNICCDYRINTLEGSVYAMLTLKN